MTRHYASCNRLGRKSDTSTFLSNHLATHPAGATICSTNTHGGNSAPGTPAGSARGILWMPPWDDHVRMNMERSFEASCKGQYSTFLLQRPAPSCFQRNPNNLDLGTIPLVKLSLFI